ncbi:MAG: carboxypeptidase regulatory-like domain-containing protein [Bryobacteraceae bacterium]
MMQNRLQALSGSLGVLMMAVVLSGPVNGQVADGNLTGVILDPSGAAVVNATVAAENLGTGRKSAASTDAIGGYRFNNLVVGSYKLTATAVGFQTTSLSSVPVELSKTTTANLTLTVGQQNETITVTDTPLLIDAATAQIANIFTSRMSTDLAVASNSTGGYLNLSLLGAGVASSGGLGAGTGPSIGGQRPRDNSFTIEGADNNRRDITGPLVSLPNDAVQEFTVLQNQFSAEYGRAAGGQFNAVMLSGTNQTHGKVYEYFQNRNLNGIDRVYKNLGFTKNPRYDQNLIGGNLGGALKHDKLFYFGNFDYNNLGRDSTAGSTPRYAPTAAGYATLSNIPTISQTNLNVLKQYLGTAGFQDGNFTSTVQGSQIPLGMLSIASSYSNTYRGLGSLDYNISSKDQLRGRYVQNQNLGTDTASNLPSFWTLRPTKSYLASISEFHTFGPSLMNEVRATFNRYNDVRTAPNVKFPGLDVFPTIPIQDLFTVVGTQIDLPQATTQNNYQLANNLTWNVGRHDLKFGVDARAEVSAMNFVSNQRGNYGYTTLNRFLLDQGPNLSGSNRQIGGKPYLGNSPTIYMFANDNWKVTRRLTVNLGMRWEYNGIAKSMKEFELNQIADVPGILTFAAPKAQRKNFAPRIGFAYAPGNSGKTSIRGGFGIAYDQTFNNIGNNTRGPQASNIITASSAATNFFANGAIRPATLPQVLDRATAQAFTVGYLGDQKLGYAVNWNFGVQHAFAKDYVVDIRYLGTKGVHLLTQTILNKVAIVTPTHSLPVYLARPTQAQLDALPLTLTQLQSENNNPWSQYGFINPAGITSFTPQGNSIYHGLAVDVTKRFSGQLMFKGGYTWSHLMDDSTADINTTTLSPRRPQDYRNFRSEWASSALDRRQRLTATWVWDTPWFRSSRHGFLRSVLGGYSLSGTYTAESPQFVTPQSAVDSNLNGDSAGDRTIINANGITGTSTDVSVLTNSANATVGYLALDPNAQYIRARAGAFATGGRNTLRAQGINNFDMSVGKSFTVRERSRIEIRADFYNALNHSQFTPGRLNNIAATQHTSTADVAYLTPGNSTFARWDRVYPSNARNIQLVLKFSF